MSETEAGVLHQGPPAAGHAIELRTHQIFSLWIDEAPFAVLFHRSVPVIEQSDFIELGVDGDLAFLIDVAPAAAHADRGEAVVKDTGVIEVGIDHDFAGSIDVAPFLADLDWRKSFTEAADADRFDHAEAPFLRSFKLRCNDQLARLIDIAEAAVLDHGEQNPRLGSVGLHSCAHRFPPSGSSVR